MLSCSWWPLLASVFGHCSDTRVMKDRYVVVGGGFICADVCGAYWYRNFDVIQASFPRQQTSYLCANEETVTLNWRQRMLMNVLLGFKEKILPNAVEN